ncbi:MAG: AmmeMemoRadiSam system protein A [Acidobacteria bacterium]|nr:AmmeMemoRadiSam system protein A [Acidobacteriota bacterium]
MSPLSRAARRWLLELARGALEAAARGESFQAPPPPSELSATDREELRRPCAAFVSLHKLGELRGCVGHVAFDTPLAEVVGEMAQAAALDDDRFPPVTPDEVPEIDIEISLLSPFFPIRPEQVIAGTHGLLVRRGLYRGLLLPQVATAYHWSGEQFLGEACRKAGLPQDAWQHGAALEAFTAEVIEEAELASAEP